MTEFTNIYGYWEYKEERRTLDAGYWILDFRFWNLGFICLLHEGHEEDKRKK